MLEVFVETYSWRCSACRVLLEILLEKLTGTNSLRGNQSNRLKLNCQNRRILLFEAL
jgi:hypothetical protein